MADYLTLLRALSDPLMQTLLQAQPQPYQTLPGGAIDATIPQGPAMNFAATTIPTPLGLDPLHAGPLADLPPEYARNYLSNQYQGAGVPEADAFGQAGQEVARMLQQKLQEADFAAHQQELARQAAMQEQQLTAEQNAKIAELTAKGLPLELAKKVATGQQLESIDAQQLARFQKEQEVDDLRKQIALNAYQNLVPTEPLRDQKGNPIIGIDGKIVYKPVTTLDRTKAYQEALDTFDKNIAPSLLPPLEKAGPPKPVSQAKPAPQAAPAVNPIETALGQTKQPGLYEKLGYQAKQFEQKHPVLTDVLAGAVNPAYAAYTGAKGAYNLLNTLGASLPNPPVQLPLDQVSDPRLANIIKEKLKTNDPAIAQQVADFVAAASNISVSDKKLILDYIALITRPAQ